MDFSTVLAPPLPVVPHLDAFAPDLTMLNDATLETVAKTGKGADTPETKEALKWYWDLKEEFDDGNIHTADNTIELPVPHGSDLHKVMFLRAVTPYPFVLVINTFFDEREKQDRPGVCLRHWGDYHNENVLWWVIEDRCPQQRVAKIKWHLKRDNPQSDWWIAEQKVVYRFAPAADAIEEEEGASGAEPPSKRARTDAST